MRALVVYESMYGNTHLIADAIADGLRETADVVVGSVHEEYRLRKEYGDAVYDRYTKKAPFLFGR